MVGRCRGWPESTAVRVGQVARGTQLAPSPVRRIRVPGWLGRIGIRPGRAHTFVPDRISSLRDVPFQNDKAAACPIMDSGVRLPFI